MLVLIDGDIYQVSDQQFIHLLEIIADTGSLEAENRGVYTSGKHLGGPAINLSCINADEAWEILGEMPGRNQRTISKIFMSFDSSNVKHVVIAEYMHKYDIVAAQYTSKYTGKWRFYNG